MEGSRSGRERECGQSGARCRCRGTQRPWEREGAGRDRVEGRWKQTSKGEVAPMWERGGGVNFRDCVFGCFNGLFFYGKQFKQHPYWLISHGLFGLPLLSEHRPDQHATMDSISSVIESRCVKLSLCV